MTPTEGITTDTGIPFTFKPKVSPFATTATGIEDLDTKVPSEDHGRKGQH